jgi:LysR family transcriptional activator of nhaA
VGLVDSIPKRLAQRLLSPVLRADANARIEVREDAHDALLAALAAHELDAVVSDRPSGPGSGRRSFDHLLGETPVQWYAAPPLARRHRPRFPGSLAGAPVLLPRQCSMLRRQLEDWFDRVAVRPRIVAEVDDGALAKVLAEERLGLVPAPTVLQADLRRRHGLVPVGPATGVVERYHVITIERRLEHPAVVALTRTARQGLFRTAASRARRSPA